MLKSRIEKKNLIVNSLIDLKEDDGKGKGRYFVSRFIEPGLAHYKELGDIVITKETLDKFIQSMVGCPVIIDHKDVTDKNVDKLRVGTISRVWYDQYDGWYYCEGILTDDEAIDLVKNQGWNVSCAYSFVSDESQKTYHGKPIDMVFTDGEFLHLAIVEDPRYEGANIVVNKKDDDVEWITVKGNHIPIKKGQSKDEAVKEFLKDKEDKSGDSLKGKYAKEDADFDEEQAKKDIEEAKKQGHKDIDDIADYLGLDPDEVIALTGEGYEDEDVKDKSGGGGEKPDIEKLKFANKGNPEGPISYKGEKRCGDYKDTYKYVVERTERIFENAKKERNPLQSFEANIRNLNGNYAIRDVLRDKGEQYHKVTQEINKYQDGFREKLKQANNNIGDITMTVLNDLTDFIKKAVSNEKEDDMKKVKNEDKRKLIDEVGGILKDKVDEELWRTVIGKLEKIAYEPSEDSKTDNEDDEEKEAKNKCKNEKEVKNSMKDLIMGGNGKVEEEKLYISRKERLEEGNKF